MVRGMTHRLMNALLFFPDRRVIPPTSGSLDYEDVEIRTNDGERLHGWWVRSAFASLGHVLLCHGNAGNVTSRAAYARLLAAAGFDVLLFDYRGYGRSTGKPSEEGTYRDARAVLEVLLRRDGVDPSRILYLGESLGGAVALHLAIESPPAGVVLQSAFTNVRDMAHAVYPFIPRAIVPDAYPSLKIIAKLTVPLLVLHGRHDDIVPLAHGRALYAAAPSACKRMEIFEQAGHNDLLVLAGSEWIKAISLWATEALKR